MEDFDIAVIGAGAAGMMCAAVAGQRGRRVVLIDHAARLAEKIRISGGGRCNFTNLQASPANYLSGNPHFCRSALARYTPRDFLSLLKAHRVSWHEKHRGQLFCDHSSEAIIDLLKAECDTGKIAWRRPVTVDAVRHANGSGFALDTSAGPIAARALIVATGGLSIPKIGATDFAYRVAKQFGHKLVEPRPALVPLTFSSDVWAPFTALSGVSLEVGVATGEKKTKVAGSFVEDLLFTHRGLSGPGVLQISSYWQPGEPIRIDLLPDREPVAELLQAKSATKRQIGNLIAEWLPSRLAHAWLETQGLSPDARVADLPDKTLRRLGEAFSVWTLVPSGTEGYRKAEVTKGGVDTRELSSATMMSERVPGLYFIGEAVDVTGWLGGYNFQWAWASGVAAGEAAAEYARKTEA
ncbi:NAD(P)/FAD-dependent oxidoreductase [Trinickia sp. EG282A]|uniref:NAD(P)/FAD-dependent oxidoreductase n=1 Tax=Trinickia sp. EG282A TaxID=3237013 RepID=UPI0034D27C0E